MNTDFISGVENTNGILNATLLEDYNGLSDKTRETNTDEKNIF